MFHNRALNNRINRVHERALRLAYQNKNLPFNELLELDNAVPIHQRNLQILVTEIFKVKSNLVPELKKQVPELKKQVFNFQEPSLQALHVYSTLKRPGNVRFYVVSMWNTRRVFVGITIISVLRLASSGGKNKNNTL